MNKNFSMISIEKPSDIIQICKISTRLGKRIFLHNQDSSIVVQATSMLGCLYIASAAQKIYIVNTQDDFIPQDFNQFIKENSYEVLQ